MPFSSKTLLAVFNLLVAVGLIAGYLYREQGQRVSRMQQARLVDVEAAGQLYLLTRDGLPVGLSRLSVESTADSVVVTEETEIHLPTPGGRVQRAHEEARQTLDEDLVLQRFHFEVASGGGAAPAQTVRLEGVRSGPDTLAIDLWTGGQKRTRHLSAPRDVVLGSGVWARLALTGQLEDGAQIRVQELDPVSLSLRSMWIQVGEMELVPLETSAGDSVTTESGVVRAYRAIQRVGGSRHELLVSERGMPIRAELPLGVNIRPATVAEVAAARERWSAPDWAEEGGDASLVTESALGAGIDVSDMEARSAGQMRVRVTGAEIPEDTDGGVQSVEDDVVTVRRGQIPEEGRAGYRLPAEVGAPSPLADRPELAPYLSAGPFVEADREEIQQAAREVLDGTRDPVLATRRISAWVYDHLDKVYTASIPSAVEALHAGEGDCNEHTVLALALYRAAGLPARAASGVAYLDGRFFFHAWPEVWMAGRWVPVDPTFGLTPAGAARVRFYTGTSKLHGVLGLLGRIDLDVLELTSTTS